MALSYKRPFVLFEEATTTFVPLVLLASHYEGTIYGYLGRLRPHLGPAAGTAW